MHIGFPVRHLVAGLALSACCLGLSGCTGLGGSLEDRALAVQRPVDRVGVRGTARTSEPSLHVAGNKDELATLVDDLTVTAEDLANVDLARGVLVLVARGAQPTGGHSIRVTAAEIRDDRVQITVETTEPNSRPVTQVITYPVDLVHLAPLARATMPPDTVWRVVDEEGNVLMTARYP